MIKILGAVAAMAFSSSVFAEGELAWAWEGEADEAIVGVNMIFLKDVESRADRKEVACAHYAAYLALRVSERMRGRSEKEITSLAFAMSRDVYLMKEAAEKSGAELKSEIEAEGDWEETLLERRMNAAFYIDIDDARRTGFEQLLQAVPVDDDEETRNQFIVTAFDNYNTQCGESYTEEVVDIVLFNH